MLTGVEYENYHYSSIIQRSTAPYAIDIYNPVLGQPRPPLAAVPTTWDSEQLETWAFFIQDQVALTERLKALAGVRFERFEHDYDDRRAANRDFNKGENGVTPRFGLIYDLTDTVAVYANTARSFKPNTGASLQGSGFDPEKASPMNWV